MSGLSRAGGGNPRITIFGLPLTDALRIRARRELLFDIIPSACKELTWSKMESNNRSAPNREHRLINRRQSAEFRAKHDTSNQACVAEGEAVSSRRLGARLVEDALEAPRRIPRAQRCDRQ